MAVRRVVRAAARSNSTSLAVRQSPTTKKFIGDWEITKEGSNRFLGGSSLAINAILDAYKQCRAEIIKAVKRPVSEPVVQSANLDRSRHLKTPRGPEISKVGSSSKTRGRPKKRIDKIEEEGEEVDRAIDVDRDDTLAFSSRLIKATTDRELRSTRGTPANSSRQSDDLHAAHESSDHKTCSDDDFVLEPVSSSRPARGKATLSSRSSGTTMSQNSLLPIEPATPTSRNQQFIPLNSESSQMLSVHPENRASFFFCSIGKTLTLRISS